MEKYNIIERLPVGGAGCHEARVASLSGQVVVVFSEELESGEYVYRNIIFAGALAFKYDEEVAAFELGNYPNAYDTVLSI